MKLYNYWRSSSSWRVRIALAWKNVPYAYEPVHLVKEGGRQNTPQYRALNPLGTVPLLEFEEAGRTIHLSQSMAILLYLEDRYPAPPLLPKEPLARARCLQLAELVNSGIQPLQNLQVLKYVKHELHGDDKAWPRHWIGTGLTALEAMVDPGARFCGGDQVTLADLFLVPQMYSARRFGVALEALPNLVRIDKECAKLPAFMAAHADAQPDAEKS